MQKLFKLLTYTTLALLVVISFLAYQNPIVWDWIVLRVHRSSVQDRLIQYGDDVDTRLKPLFAENKVLYPPLNVKLVYFKDEKNFKTIWRG